ncbi:hypothetical protein HKD37_18G050890 [Glycine soja]
MNAHPCQDGIHQLTLRQREVRIMITGQDVAKQQRHPCLSQGSHVGAYDSHTSPDSSPGKILSRYAQQLGDGLLIKPIGPIPPLAILALLALL